MPRKSIYSQAAASTFAPAKRPDLLQEQAVFQFINWLQRFPDPDEVLRKAGLNRSHLRALAFDDEVAQCIDTRREAVVATPWRLEPQQSRFNKWMVAELTPWVETLVRSALNAVLYGYSVTEVVYRSSGGRLGIARLSEKPFEWFEPTPQGDLRYWAEGAGDFVVVDPRKFLLTVRQTEYRQPRGEALFSRLYWPVFFKANGRKFWARFLERHGEPLLLGSVADQQKFLDDLSRLSLAHGLPLQPGDSVQAISSSQAGEFERFEQTMIRAIQKLILGQTLTSEVGSSGSYAAAQVHNSVREGKRNADIRLVTSTVQSLVNTLCQLNGQPAPQFVMADDTGLEPGRAERDATLLPVLRASGITFSRDYFLDRYDLRDTDLADIEAPPAPEPDASGNLATFAAKPAAPFTPKQMVIEDAYAAWTPPAVPISGAALRSAITAATDPHDLEQRLALLLRDTDHRAFQVALERAQFAADVLGYLHAEPGSEP